MNTDFGLETSVPDWIIEHPELLKRFEEWGLDYSCGGKSLETACWERHLDPQEILAKIAASLDESR